MMHARQSSQAAELLARDAAHTWHPYTQHGLGPAPLPVVGARGSKLMLADGRVLLDAISSWWACLHGHGEPALVDAMVEQARTLDHVLFAGTTHEPAVGLAEELIAAGPEGLQRVFYSDNGSTAVEVALKMAYQAWVHAGEPGRTVFLALEGSYHGDTFGAMSVGDPVPFFEPYTPFLFEARRIPPTEEALGEVMREVGSRVAAVIVEPLVQGARGMVMHSADFLRAVRRACDEQNTFMIADEVMTGFGRTGTLFACEQANIAPDLMCIAKGLTGGMLPLAATLATENLFEAFLHTDKSRFFPHGHTWTANPIGCAVGRASLKLCLTNDVPARLAALGRRIEKRVRAGFESASSGEFERRVLDLRSLGGIVAIELRPPAGDASGYFAGSVARMRASAIERGVLLRPLGNVLYAIPPACTSESEADTIADALVALTLEV